MGAKGGIAIGAERLWGFRPGFSNGQINSEISGVRNWNPIDFR
jgi:hypothetical protein